MTEAGLPRTLADFEPAARALLPAAVFDYIAGGAGDESTLSANVDAWRRIEIVPQVLRAPDIDLSVSVLGQVMPHPIVIAPMAYQRVASAEGELDMARAAAATSSVICLSTLATVGAREVAGAAPQGRRWFQVYVFRDRGVTHELIAQALASGYDALVITVDLTAYGIRDRDTRSGFAVEAAVPAMQDAGMPGELEPEAAVRVIDASLSWSDIAGFAARYRVPVLVKGVLSASDASRALAEGAAGVVVSNHGGRQLDGTPATARVLPGIVDAVAGRGAVLVDGGIRRGTDVLRALALGANAVMIGRPLYWGLAVGGAAGAERVLELFLEEFGNALCLSGAGAASALDREFLGSPGGLGPQP